jgi:FkbM family methyltransferase
MKILDIGANNGDYAKNLCRGDTVVVAVEPDPSIVPDLAGYPNIVWERTAVSDHVGFGTLHLSNSGSVLNSMNPDWLSRGRFHEDGNGSTVEVPTTTIDALWNAYGGFDHIKIDVEGYENIVMLGMTSAHPCSIQFEWACEWVNDVTIPALRHLVSLGYSKFAVLSGEKDQHDFDPYNLPEEHITHDEVLNRIHSACQGNHEAWGMILVQG